MWNAKMLLLNISLYEGKGRREKEEEEKAGPRHTVEFQYAAQWRTDTLAKKIHGRHNVEYLTRHTGEKT